MQKDSHLLIWICGIAFVLAGVFFVLAPSSSYMGEEESVSVTVLSEGDRAVRMTERKNYRVLDYQQLEEVWALAHGPTVAQLPTVDFTTHEVLAVFDGERSSGGYGIGVDEVTDNGGTRYIRIRHTEPGASCMTTQAITSPFQIVMVEKTTKTINRSDRSVTVACE